MATSVLDSPPELSGSRSSKSSSFQSSSHLDHDGVFSNASHFEDIGLEDESQSPSVGPLHHQTTGAGAWFDKQQHHSNVSKRSLINPGGLPGSRNTAPAISPSSISPRELMLGPKRKSEASVMTTAATNASLRRVVTADLHPGASQQRGALMPKRGFTSPSTPVLTLGRSTSPSSRSPSPSKSVTDSLRRMSSGVPPHGRHGSVSSLRPPSRRGSWQPKRKSTQELEEECHDSDDDVPDDAIFYNIPCSPRPPSERGTSIGSRPSSVSSSPEHKSPLSRSIPAIGRNKTPPALAMGRSPGRDGVFPLSPIKPGLPRGATTGSLADSETYPKCHVKTWTAAISEMGHEAQELTEALEEHAEKEGQDHERHIQSGSSAPVTPVSEISKRRAKAKAIELPPIRKSNVMIDPLPASREKEAVLTRTRPSWLPPKSQKEERKHLKQYQKMMASSLEADRKRQERDHHDQVQRDQTKESVSRIWDEHVIPHWEFVHSEPRTRELWWRGVPPRSRAAVWPKAIRNDLELTQASYDAALRRAKDKQREIAQHPDADSRTAKWFSAIQRDVGATYPELRIFQSGGPLNESLVDVLLAYSMYRSDVGYIFGLHQIAALLLLNLSPVQTFITLSNVLNRPVPLAFLTGDSAAINRTYSITLRALAYKAPKLHNHLANTLALEPASYLEPIFATLFTKNIDIDLSSRIWDVYVFEGDSFLVRTAVAVLGKLEGRLYGSAEDVKEILGWEAFGAPSSGSGDAHVNTKESAAAGAPWDLGGEDDLLDSIREAGKEERARKLRSPPA